MLEGEIHIARGRRGGRGHHIVKVAHVDRRVVGRLRLPRVSDRQGCVGAALRRVIHAVREIGGIGVVTLQGPTAPVERGTVGARTRRHGEAHLVALVGIDAHDVGLGPLECQSACRHLEGRARCCVACFEVLGRDGHSGNIVASACQFTLVGAARQHRQQDAGNNLLLHS